MASCGTFQKLSPLSLLSHLSSSYDSAQLKVFSESVAWSIYLEEGKIIYASHSIAPFDRLDCHLHRLGHQVPSLTSEVRAQLSLIFETDSDTQSMLDREYQAISWLVNHQYLTTDLAAQLIAGLVREVIESFLLVKTGKYEFGGNRDDVPGFCRLDLLPILNECQQRLQGWKFLGPQVWSPYQRLYFSNRHKTEQEVAPEVQQKLSAILKGFSFRHLAVLLNQDELQLANSLYQYIVDGTILLQDPYPPFDRLPKTFEELNSVTPTVQLDETPQLPISEIADRHISDRHIASPPKALNSNSSVQSPQFFPSTPKNSAPDERREELVGRKSDYEPSPTRLDREEQRIHSFPAQPAETVADPPYVNRPASTKPAQPISNKSKLDAYPAKPADTISDRSLTNSPSDAIADNIPDTSIAKRTYKIVCVDDSPAILQELHRCLEDDIFSVYTISNPIKALMQIIKVKPDLILLDVNMAGIDGYELCRLLRNHSLFKNTPIIMVTANTGLINRVKARIVGASGYLTKPFTQPDLLKWCLSI